MIEDLLTEINNRGFLLNNLYQLSTGRWYASIRNTDGATALSDADTAELALALALDNIDNLHPLIDQTNHCFISKIGETTYDLQQVFASILNKPALRRRI